MLARNATLNLFAEGWTFLLLIVAVPKLVSSLGETSFGLFSLAWVAIGYLTFLDIGVNRAATKFVSQHLVTQDGTAVRTVIRTAFTMNLALGIVGGLAITFAAPYLIHSAFKVSPNLESQARMTFYAVALAIPVLLVQGIFRAVLSSFQRFAWITSVNVFVTTAQWLAAGIMAWKGYGVGVVVLVTVLARSIATLAYGMMMSRLVPDLHLFRIRGLAGLSQLVRFGGWVSVSQVISPILVYLDRMLIASFVSLGAVTFYVVPYELMTRLRVIPSSLAATLYPAFSERSAVAYQIHLQQLYERSVRYLLLALLPGVLFLVVLGSDALGLWMGHDFALKTTAVLEILALGVLCNGLSYVPYNMLQAVGRPDLTGKFHLLELPPYLLFCAFAIPRWGIEGAAIASTARFTLDLALLFWAAGKYCQRSLRDFWATSLPRISLLGITLAMLLLSIRVEINGSWTRLALGAAAMLFYAGGAWILIVKRQEKPRIARALRMMLGQPAL